MAPKVKVSVLIEEEDLERIEDLSRQTGRSISSMVRAALKEFLERKLAAERGQGHE